MKSLSNKALLCALIIIGQDMSCAVCGSLYKPAYIPSVHLFTDDRLSVGSDVAFAISKYAS